MNLSIFSTTHVKASLNSATSKLFTWRAGTPQDMEMFVAHRRQLHFHPSGCRLSSCLSLLMLLEGASSRVKSAGFPGR